MKNVLAVDIGGTHFRTGLFDEQGRRLLVLEGDTDRVAGRDWMLSQLTARCRELMAQTDAPVHACGLSFGGPVDFLRQRVTSVHSAGWQGFELGKWMEQTLGIPCRLDNDANAGALGEARFGAGRGYSPLFYMTLSTGIGGGIYHDGRIWRGADSYGGEIGHLTIRPDGPPCLCGWHGCFERMCCGLWLERDYGKTAEELMRDPAFVSRYVVDLALGLKTSIMLLNPARIVIGGGIAKAGDRLFDPLRAELRRQITDWSGARIDVAPAALGDDSVLYGALALAEDQGMAEG